MVFSLAILILLAEITGLLNGAQFRGGTIDWRPLNSTPSGSTVQISIHQRYVWSRSGFSPMCDNTMISTAGLISTGIGSLQGFTGGSFTSVSADVYCTDFNITTDYSDGERYNTVTLPLNTSYIIGFTNSAWLPLTIKGGGTFQITGQINLAARPDGRINTSPVLMILPVIYRMVNVQQVYVVRISDADTTDTLRCRWSTNNSPVNTNNYDECGSICSPTLPLFTLYSNNCTLVFTLNTTSYYAVALQIEDFYNSTTTTPMSSVPVQFLFYGISTPTVCSTPPQIIGNRPDSACIGAPIGSLINETVIAQVGCPGKTIVEFTTTSPIGLVKSAIMNPSTGIYMISLLFTPNISQYGPQIFCAAAIDNTNVQSDSWCVTFLVGFTEPKFQSSLSVQGSASPIGTVFANQSIFSIQTVNGISVYRPIRSGTYITFHDATLNGTIALRYDCASSSNVIYSGSTVIINAPFNWTMGHSYYVTFDSGVATGNDFCHVESAPITSYTFWRFDIWNPVLSSTTSAIPTTTLPASTNSLTTRGISTTTPNANLTTTGIVITTTPVVTTTPKRNTTTIRTTTTTVSSAISKKIRLLPLILLLYHFHF